MREKDLELTFEFLRKIQSLYWDWIFSSRIYTMNLRVFDYFTRSSLF